MAKSSIYINGQKFKQESQWAYTANLSWFLHGFRENWWFFKFLNESKQMIPMQGEANSDPSVGLMVSDFLKFFPI